MIIYYFIMHNNDLKKYLCSNKAIMFLKISWEQSPKAVFKTWKKHPALLVHMDYLVKGGGQLEVSVSSQPARPVSTQYLTTNFADENVQ